MVGAVGGMGARVWVLVCSRGGCMVAVSVMVVELVAAVVGKLLVRRWMWLNMGVCGMRPCGCGCECGMLCVVVVWVLVWVLVWVCLWV